MLPHGLVSLDSGDVKIRKTISYTQRVYEDGDRSVSQPVTQAVVGAVLKNPYTEAYDEDLLVLQDLGAYLGKVFMQEALQLLPGELKAYGKAGVVGGKGELEHIAAILHPKFGQPTRRLAEGVSILPSVKKRGSTGCSVDIPIHHKTAMLVRDYFDSVTVAVQDAPLEDELLVLLAAADAGRPHARMGGLQEHEISDRDGLR